MESESCADTSLSIPEDTDRKPVNGGLLESQNTPEGLLKSANHDGEQVESKNTPGGLLYAIQETPPWGVLISSSLQHVLLGLGGALSTAYVIADVICAGDDHPIRAKLFCTSLFMTGICTILQSLIGVRLPVFQGVCSTFLIPLVAMKSFKDWDCTKQNNREPVLSDMVTSLPGTENMSDWRYLKDQEMNRKLREMSGCLILSSLLEVLVGLTGLVGVLLRFIGPITVATVISLIGLSLYKIPLEYARTNWTLAAVCIVLSMVFMLYLNKVRVPVFIRCKKTSRYVTTMRLPVFKMFPILFSIAITWLICGILTATGVFTEDPGSLQYRSRTDVRLGVIHNTPWFYIPYPGQFGSPLFNTPIFIGFCSAVISSVLESIGDYYAAADISEVPPPPSHAVNRGILLEGLGSVLSGAMGAGHATTSSTPNVALLGISQVASRSCLIFTGFLCLVFSVIGKLGAVLATMPDPVLGGAMFVIFGILGSIGIFSLRTVDMRSSRNLAIFGISLYVGIVIPEWTVRYPESINTGNLTTDGIIHGILGSPMFLGGFVAAILDNTVEGTQKERGFTNRQSTDRVNRSPWKPKDLGGVYDLPFLTCRTSKCLKLFPFLPYHEHTLVTSDQTDLTV